jgi:hypothetical protein
MASDKDKKDKGKDQAKAKAKDQAKPKPQDAGKAKDKDKKAKGKEAAAVAEAPAPKKVEAPRPPADPRLKVLKKFRGKFLPRGPLRDRLDTLMQRWDSGDDHGGVTVEELRSLYDDWRAHRANPRKAKAARAVTA